MDKGLSISLDKTKVTVFNTTQAWVTRSKPDFFLGKGKRGIIKSYRYLGVTFRGPQFSLQEAACAPLCHGYVVLDALERNCAHLQFQEP